MRSVLLVALLPALAAAADPPALQIVRPVISQMDGGAPDVPGFEHAPGETLFFTCRVANFGKTSELKIHLAYSIQAFDPKGIPLAELFKNEITDEITPQDKEWMPKIATELPLPPLIPSGAYKIVVKVNDLVAQTSAELVQPFQVRARDVAPSDTLIVRNFRFYREETDTQPIDNSTYRTGDALWARFDITGFRYGPANKIDVSYQLSILGAEDKVLWKQPEPATEQSESFYPKAYVPASLSLSLQGTKPGRYTMSVQVKDAIGNQTCESRQTFTVEPR